MAKEKIRMSDYENIFQFMQRASQAEDLYGTSLQLMQELFHISLVIYTKWQEPSQDFTYLTLTKAFDNDFARKCHDYFLADDLFEEYNQNQRSNSWKGIFYFQDTDLFKSDDSKGSEVMEFLHRQKVHYIAVMVIARDPNEHFVFCRPEKEGPFSEREKTILQHLQIFLSTQAEQRRAAQKEKDIQQITEQLLDQSGIGQIIIDENRNIISCSRNISELFSAGGHASQAEEAVSYILDLFAIPKDQPVNLPGRERMTYQGGRRITISRPSLPYDETIRKQYYLLTVTDSGDSEFDPEAGVRYSMTQREIQVADLIVKGYSTKQIADTLVLSSSTVKIHISNIFRKLQIHSRSDAVHMLSRKRT